MTDAQSYYEYLTGRSLSGYLYRRLWLYPRLNRQIDGRTLDVGCGVGDMLRARPGTVGVDINPLTVAHCRNLGLDARLMEPDRLPFDDASFDSAILDNVLEHILHPEPLLAEVARVLRPDGVLVVGVPGARGYRHDPDHKVFYDAARLKGQLAASGFRCTKILRMPLPLPGLDRIMKSYCIYGVFRLGLSVRT